MIGVQELLAKSALIHDIGKHCRRAGIGQETHSKEGVKFLRTYIGDVAQASKLLQAVQYHHANALKQAKLDASDDVYLIYESDNIAAGIDRREDEEEKQKGFSAEEPLRSVFDKFGSNDTAGKHSFLLRGLGQDEKINYPLGQKIKATAADYRKLLQELESNLKRKNLMDMSVNELLHILEGIWSYVPASTNQEEVNDISLYDHSKMTAAVALCLKEWFAEQDITDYRTWCFGSRNQELREKELFLLITGDLSGIQDFIYTIPSAGALKGLRGRSFYLELLIEHIADELLEQCGINRCNLIYTGGGHFYILAPNTQVNRGIVDDFAAMINQWLLQHYGTALYLAVGCTACTANEFMRVEKGSTYIDPFQRVGRELSRSKLSRYKKDDLDQLFREDSFYNKIKDGMRECSICHTSVQRLSKYKGNQEGDTEACDSCNALYILGEKILTGGNVFFVQEQNTNNAIPLPAVGRSLYINVYTEQQAEQEQKMNSPIRIYTKNDMKTSYLIGTHLWVGDYFAKRNGKTMDFGELAQASGGVESEQTIKRLGVLRADVDNLGAVFIAGLPSQYRTLSRYAALSRQLSLFFKHYINYFCRGILAGADGEVKQQFNIISQNKQTTRQVHIVYSGGDDLFFVGAWDDLIELAVDIRRAFAQFTCGRLTFSAGVALVPPKFPVMQMARLAGNLESIAKQQPTKDSIALFGAAYTTSDHNIELTCEHIYQWNEFTDNVCRDKIQFLCKHLDLECKKDHRLEAGKSLLYRLMELLRAQDGIYLARFAYTLARMQPTDKKDKDKQKVYRSFADQMYQWYTDPKQKQSLITALQLIIYSLRDKNKEA